MYSLIIKLVDNELLLCLALVAMGLQLARIPYRATVRLPLHFRVARAFAWLIMATFQFYIALDTTGAYFIQTVALSRLSFLALVVSEIWTQGWILWQIYKQKKRYG